MKLSNNLSLNEVIKSNTAARLNIDNEPTAEHLKNLQVTADKVFQPIREHFNVPIYISSGYRSKALNEAIGGSKTSQHSLGQAFDIDQDDRSTISNLDVFNYVKDNLKFTQLILEFPDGKGNPAWVHVGYDPDNLKNQILISRKINNKTKYEVWKP